MSPTSRRLAGAVALATITFATGCGGAAEPPPLAPAVGGVDTPAPVADPSVAATTVPESRGARWAGDGTAAPRLRNTGDDLVAVFQSLERHRRWLEAHHPDPRL